MTQRVEHKIENDKELRWCNRCKQWLPLPSFAKNAHEWDKLQHTCNSCHTELYKTWYREHKRYKSDRTKEYAKAHPETRRKAQLKFRFGMSLEEYDAIFASQGGVCAICKGAPNGKNLCVDHDHETEEVRGLLCHECNAMLGFAKNSTAILQTAVGYLGGKQ